MMVNMEEDPGMLPVDGDDYDYDEETESEGDGDGDAAAPPLRKGPWTPQEDERLRDYVQAHGDGNWNRVRINAGLNRCGKSCRLRWTNHLRPDLKKEPFSDEEVDKILRMHMAWGNKWAKMAALMPGRTDNEIKNYWNTRLKRHQRAGLPIYPEYLVSQASNQDMYFGTPEEPCDTKRPNEFSHNVLDIKDLIHEYFDQEAFSKIARNMVDIPSPSLAGPNSLPTDAMDPLKLLESSDCMALDYHSSLSFVQIPDEYEKVGFNCGMKENQLAPLGNTIISGRPIFDGNPSTSWATQRPMNLELPSIQYSNYVTCNPIEQADTVIESPGSLKSETVSLQITGLESIVHKGDGIVNPIKSQGVPEVPPPLSYNQVSQLNMYHMRHSFSLVSGDNEIEGCPLGEIQPSKSSSSSDTIHVESKCDPDTSFNGKHPSWADIDMLDASVQACLLNNGSLIDGDFCEEAKLSTAGHGLDSFPWNSKSGL